MPDSVVGYTSWSRSGGRVVETGETYEARLATDRRHLWPYLAVAGLALFMLELVWRRRMA